MIAFGALRLAVVVAAMFAITFLRMRRRNLSIADCLHRGIVHAIAAGLVYLLIELALFELGFVGT